MVLGLKLAEKWYKLKQLKKLLKIFNKIFGGLKLNAYLCSEVLRFI